MNLGRVALIKKGSAAPADNFGIEASSSRLVPAARSAQHQHSACAAAYRGRRKSAVLVIDFPPAYITRDDAVDVLHRPVMFRGEETGFPVFGFSFIDRI